MKKNIMKSTLLSIVKYCNGFQGVFCHHCEATHNVIVDIPCIICEKCGVFVGLSWSHHQMTFKKPDFGWSKSLISWALKNHGHYRDILKSTEKYLGFQSREFMYI